jgi:hypothetical protein
MMLPSMGMYLKTMKCKMPGTAINKSTVEGLIIFADITGPEVGIRLQLLSPIVSRFHDQFGYVKNRLQRAGF